jgi:hypothetical protein
MLAELRGYKLLTGFRGSKPADIDRLVDVVLRLCALTQSLGSQAESVEINPLLVDGDRIEALDVLITRRIRPES